MRNLITATLIASAPLMAVSPSGTYRDYTTINTNSTPVSNIIENVQQEYYYVKEYAKVVKPLEHTFIVVKGYQYTKQEYDSEEEVWYTSQKIDYYIRTSNGEEYVDNLTYSLVGELSQNSIDHSIDEYEISYITNQQDINLLNSFMNSTTYTYNQLSTVRQITGNVILLTDAGENWLTQETDQVYTYLRIRLEVGFTEENVNIIDAVQATQGIYKQLTVSETINNPIPPTVIPNYEVIDLPGLMFQILGMPFAWASIAFNLTLFPGTPYAINLSHLFFAVLGSLILIIILKKVLK